MRRPARAAPTGVRLTPAARGLKVAGAMGVTAATYVLAWVAAAAAAAPAPPAGAADQGGDAAKPAFVFKADKGFIDDAFALDQGGRIAILRTDSASFARLQVVDLRTGATRHSFDVGNPQQLFERVLFAGPGGGIVVITRDPATDARSAQHFTAEGKALGHVGPATDFGLAARGGREYLVAWDRRALTSGATTYVLSQHRLDGLTRVGKQRGYTIAKDGTLARPPLKFLGFQDGYSQLVGQKPGGYDKAKDVRQPDRAAIVDGLDGQLILDADIADVLAWAYGNQLRRRRPNRSLFAVVSDEQDALHLVDVLGRKVPLSLAGTFSHYDPSSLEEQEDGASRSLYFSFAVDPLHPEALARRKADKTYLDVYRARVRGAPDARTPPAVETRRLVRAPLGDRPASWVAQMGENAGFVALLRKHKSFSRGGTELEVYAVGPN